MKKSLNMFIPNFSFQCNGICFIDPPDGLTIDKLFESLKMDKREKVSFPIGIQWYTQIHM